MAPTKKQTQRDHKRLQLADKPPRIKIVKTPKPTLSLKVNTGEEFPLLEGVVEDPTEVYWPDEEKNTPPGGLPEGKVPLRAINSFAFVKDENMCTGNNLRASKGVELVGWVTSLSGGVRRAHRVLCGYSPTPESAAGEEMPDHVWRMRSVVCSVQVRKLTSETIHVLGFRGKVVMAEATDGSACYVLQWPHPSYESLWNETVGIYARAGITLPVWRDTDPAEARPAWCHPWTMWMLRLELGLPSLHPEDPEEWPNLAEAGDTEPVHECGESDAESIDRDDASEFPTGRAWRDGRPTPWPRRIGAASAQDPPPQHPRNATPPRPRRRK